jgi:hypothetical protein
LCRWAYRSVSTVIICVDYAYNDSMGTPAGSMVDRTAIGCYYAVNELPAC